MYNIIKNKIYSYFYCDFVKQSYKKVSEIDDKEEVYYSDNKLVVFVKDEEIGQRIYDIIKTLKDRKEVIFTNSINFRINKYFIDNKCRVQVFCVDFFLNGKRHNLSKRGDLQRLVDFVNAMQNKGYVIDGSRFENEKCSSISNFLSFFVLDDGKVEYSKGWLIKYIHYVLSDGGNLDEFYKIIVDDKRICNAYEFPYGFSIIRMCYNYFVTGNVPENIYNVLVEEEFKWHDRNYADYLIATNSTFESNLGLIEENDEYTIYDGNIKIYHNISSEFEEFLINNKNKLTNSNIRETVEEIDKVIFDFSGSVIGYKFFAEEMQNSYTILDKKFESQCEILDFMSAIRTYLLKAINRMDFKTDNGKNDFNIEQSLICMGDSNINFKITTIKELFDLATNDNNMLKRQITTIFFKVFFKHLSQKYGRICDEKQFLDKIEVRYLSPILATEFINYALEKQVDFDIAIEEFYEFLYNTRKPANKDIFYDSRFEYNPLDLPFIFDYEAEKKYGIKIEDKMNKTLSDGRRLITFNRHKKVSKLKNKEDSLRQKIYDKLGNVEDDHVKIVGISEIIYSKKINKYNMYNVVGYITEPVKGNQLTEEVLLNLNNQDLLKVAGYLFTNFSNYYIPLNAIWMDNDFMFYIDILDESFKIKRLKLYSNFTEWIFEYLNKIGYNMDAFSELDLYHNRYKLKLYLLEIANSFDAYCDEHNVYYNSRYGSCYVCLKTKYFVPQGFEKNTRKIFEDLYAKHYRIDNRHNLKVYKTSYLDMSEIEKNVDRIISSRLNSQELKLGQDCFVPYKKALDNNKQFIGYIYDTVEFNNSKAGINICNDIKDSQELKNLPRLMSLIRLILQIKEITKRDLGFIKNPFSYVFLNKSHKKQVQILNIEFLKEKANTEDTIKWTCEYVREILDSDPSIEVDISDCHTDLDSILTRLQDLSKDMTKYCTIHNMYYRNSYLFCPKCINKDQIESLEAEEVDASEITRRKLENEGGESFIYSYDGDLVVKVFKEEINYDLKSIIIVLVSKRKEQLEEINNKNLKYKYVIPKKLLIDKKTHKIFAYIMDKVSGIPLSTLRDKAEVKKLGLTMNDVFEILITVGKGIETLHANNIYIGDLNGRNILFDTQKNVYFLDFDGMGVDNIAPTFCTDGYIDPISKKKQNITMKDDWYSFAVQAFYYLTYTHPFNGIFTIEKDGRNIALDIPDKMERKISLLGNHGMKVPTIADPWDWMNEELKNAFLEIFEGNSRENIVPYLVCQYEKLYKSNKPYGKCIRINPKFIAKEFIPFGKDVERIINHYTAVYKKGNKYYISILLSEDEPRKIMFNTDSSCMYIYNILLSEDKTTAFTIFEDRVIAIDLKTNHQIYSEEICDPRNVVINGNTLYFTKISEGKNVIFQVDIMPNGDVKKEKINFLTNQQTKRLFVKFNSKFVLVKRASENVDEIYCNSQKLCDMECSIENSYDIIYDKFTKLWLVLNNEQNGVVINTSNGTYKKFKIQENINGRIGNVSFNKGVVYIPSQDFLYIVNINDQITTKKMECRGIMTLESKLYDINTDGFSVITNNMLYEVRRG